MKTRKFMAILVAVAMIVTMLPMVAFAEDYDYDYEADVDYNALWNEDYETWFIKVEAKDDDDNTLALDKDTIDSISLIVEAGEELDEPIKLEPDSDTKLWFGVAKADRDLDYKKSGLYVFKVKPKVGDSYTFGFDYDPDEVEFDKTSIDLNKPVSYSAAGSTVTVSKDTVDIDEEVEFTVRFRNNYGLIRGMPVAFWIVSDRDAESVSGLGDAENEGSLHDGLQYIAVTDNSGNVTFKVSSSVAGDVTISVYKYDEANATTLDEDKAILIGKETITFESDLDVATVELGVEDVSVENGKLTITAGKSFDLIATVLDNSDYWVEDEDVTFYEYYKKDEDDNYGSRKKIGTATTDKYGEAELTVRRDKAGYYEFYARANGENSDRIEVYVKPASAYSVEAKDDVKYAEVDEPVKVKFVYYDSFGSKVALDEVEIEIFDPDDDELKDKDYDPTWSNKELQIEFTPEEEGEYTVRAYIPGTGIYAETIVNTTEFGEVEELGLKLYKWVKENNDEAEDKVDNAAVEMRDEDDNDFGKEYGYRVKVFEYDENGIEREVDASDVYFSTSDATIATVDREGEITLKEDASGVVTITAVHEETGLSGSLDITVSGAPVGIEVEVAVDDLEAEVEMQYVDVNGNLAVEGDDDEGYRVYASDLDVDDQEDFDNGKASFVLVAEEYGTYSVRVVTDEGLSKTFDVTFTEEEEAPAASKVILTIGSKYAMVGGEMSELDAPAFIEDGRTFVPVRFLAEAFGAEADWEPKDAAVETVFLTRDDMEITIGIGDEFLTVTKDGDAEVMTFDGAARIVDGRTFLPFRAIAEAFGAEVDYGPVDGPVEWVSFE